MRSDYINTDTISHILWALQPANRLVCEVALETGWRVDDILELKTSDVVASKNKKRHALSITEKKTGKRSTRYLSASLIDDLLEQSGSIYVFQGRDDYRKHRTRQAVFIDLKRTAKRFKIPGVISPHSLRKNYAVYLKQQGKTFEEIQKAFNHENLITTIIYVLSDELIHKYKKGRN